MAASFCDGLFYQATVGLELWSKGAVSIICVLFLSLPALIFCFVFLSTPILLVPAAPTLVPATTKSKHTVGNRHEEVKQYVLSNLAAIGKCGTR